MNTGTDEARQLVARARRGGPTWEEVKLQRQMAAEKGRKNAGKDGGKDAAAKKDKGGKAPASARLPAASGKSGPAAAAGNRPASARGTQPAGPSRSTPKDKDRMNNLINLVDRMIESSYPIDYNAKPFFRTALWEASWKGDEDVVQLLLKSKAKVDHADYQGRTPLHEVSYYGHLRMVDLLIQKGHPVDPKDKFDHTPLFRAVEAGRHEIVLKLVSCKAEIGSRDQKKLGLQHYAAFNGRPHMSEWLFYKGAWGNQFSLEDSPPSGGAMSRQTTGSPKGTSGAPRPGHDEEGDMGDKTATMLPSMRRINKDQDLIDYVRQDFFAAPELAKKREEDDTPPTSEVAVNSRDLRKDADGGRQGGSKRVASDAAPHRPSMAVGGKDPAFTKQ